MGQLIIKTLDDLKKLIGWQIKDVKMQAGGAQGVLALTMSHPAAEAPVMLVIVAEVSPGMAGNIPYFNGRLRIETKDVEG